MAHEHAHHNTIKNLKTAFFLNLGFTIFEIIGGLYVNSVAIISDAVHDLGDSLSLGTSWYLEIKSKGKPSNKFTFGYRRFSLLGALINSIVLLAGSVYVINEAIERIVNPEPSNADGMILFALTGIVVNGYAAWKMIGGKSLNEKVISWHLVEDVLGWTAILIVAIVLQFYDNDYLDPALSLLIAIFILYNVFKRLKETLVIFMQSTPKEIDLLTLEEKILNLDGVVSTHHTHLWSLDGEKHVFTCHVKLKEINTLQELLIIKKELKNVVQGYRFAHHTIEVELSEEECSMDLKHNR